MDKKVVFCMANKSNSIFCILIMRYTAFKYTFFEIIKAYDIRKTLGEVNGIYFCPAPASKKGAN
jgi:hypothetical protein